MNSKVILSILKLLGKLSILLPTTVLKRKAGIKAFERQLTSMGIDKDVVNELSQEYKNIIDFKSFRDESFTSNKNNSIKSTEKLMISE